MKQVLIDTDVILDFFLDRLPFSDDATRIIALCEIGKIQGYISAVIISNVYYILRKNASHEKVITHLSKLISILEIVNIDKNTVYTALTSDFKDFEDALQNFAAVNSENIKVILTRNIKDFRNSILAVMTPEDHLKTFDIN